MHPCSMKDLGTCRVIIRRKEDGQWLSLLRQRTASLIPFSVSICPGTDGNLPPPLAAQPGRLRLARVLAVSRVRIAESCIWYPI